MTTSEAILILKDRIDMCRDRWEPMIEDSIGVTYGGYRAHDEYCDKCIPILTVLEAYDI